MDTSRIAIAVAMALGVTISPSATAPERVYEYTGAAVHEEHWLWDKALLTESELTRFGVEFKKRARTEFNRAFIFSSREEAAKVRFGKGMSDYPYGLWREGLRDALAVRGPLAEVIMTRTGALLRLRRVDGHVDRRILWGRDPFDLQGAGGIEILYVTLLDVRRIGEYFAVYARIGENSNRDLRKTTALLAEHFGISEIRVKYRRDSWFIYAEDFPYFYPFDEQMAIPSESEYTATPTVTCWAKGANASCRVSE